MECNGKDLVFRNGFEEEYPEIAGRRYCGHCPIGIGILKPRTLGGFRIDSAENRRDFPRVFHISHVKQVFPNLRRSFSGQKFRYKN